MLTQMEHQSSVILLSQEQCPEMICLDEEFYPVKCLELQGLATPDILQNLGLSDAQSWGQLMELYEGHPVYLKEIARTIKKVFLGKVSDFLTEDTPIITEGMKAQFRELFHRLSPVEKQIALELSKREIPMSREELKTALSFSSTELINGLDSLQRRYLVSSKATPTISFNLSPIFRAYLQIYDDNR